MRTAVRQQDISDLRNYQTLNHIWLMSCLLSDLNGLTFRGLRYQFEPPSLLMVQIRFGTRSIDCISLPYALDTAHTVTRAPVRLMRVQYSPYEGREPRRLNKSIAW
jgi:hypothetical protein